MKRRTLLSTLTALLAGNTGGHPDCVIPRAAPSTESPQHTEPASNTTAITNPAAPSTQPTCPTLAADHAEIPSWLQHWRKLQRHPIWESEEPLIRLLVRCIEQNSPLELIYHRGSQPGKSRLFSPILVYRVHSRHTAPVYVLGWCHQRQSQRTFRVDWLRPTSWQAHTTAA